MATGIATRVEKVTDKGSTFYEAHKNKAGKALEVKVDVTANPSSNVRHERGRFTSSAIRSVALSVSDGLTLFSPLILLILSIPAGINDRGYTHRRGRFYGDRRGSIRLGFSRSRVRSASTAITLILDSLATVRVSGPNYRECRSACPGSAWSP